MKLKLFVFVFIIFFLHSVWGECIHDKIAKQVRSGVTPQQYDDSRSDWSRRNEKRAFRASFAPIRIVFDTSFLAIGGDTNFTCTSAGQTITTFVGVTGSPYTCTNADVLTANKFSFINNTLLEQARTRFSATLGVRPVAGNLFLKNDTNFNCYLPQPPIPVPIAYKSGHTGIPNADIVIFVTARKILSASVLAFAAECDSDQNARPIAGFINFDPAKMDESDTSLFEQYLKTAMHELSHVLGFSSFKIPAFRQDDGVTVKPVNQMLVNVSTSNGFVLKVKSPSVLAEGRSYYNCPTLDGVDLENDGDSGTALSHWEKRIMLDEYIIGTASKHPFFSAFTAAFFNDSGFYSADFSSPFLEPLQWGRGQGCNFLDQSKCDQWTQPGSHCTGTQTGCSADRRGIGQCFAADPLTDGCSYLFTFQNLWCIEPGTTRVGGVLNINYDAGEIFDTSSRCFTSTLVKGLPTGALTAGDFCYKTACAGPNRLKLVFDDFHYPCTPSTTISVLGFGGTLTCPPDSNICGETINDPTWAEITSVSPAVSSPNAQITIKGTGFVTGASLFVDNIPLTCTFVSNTSYSCQLPAADKFNAFQSIIDQSHSVFYKPPSGIKTAVGVKSLTVNLSGADIASSILKWFTDNPLYTGLIFGGIALLIGIGVFLVIQQQRKARAARKAATETELPMN